MRTAIAAALFALVTAFARAAAAEMPCEGANDSCSWSCDTNDQGDITQYNVSCQYSDYCVDALTNDWNFGGCDSQAPTPDPFDQIAVLEAALYEVGKTCGDYFYKK